MALALKAMLSVFLDEHEAIRMEYIATQGSLCEIFAGLSKRKLLLFVS